MVFLKKYRGNGGDVIIPNGVTEIGDYTFASCEFIKATYKGKTYTYENISDLYKAING